MGIKNISNASAWELALLEPDAFVFDLNGHGRDEVGVEKPEHVELQLVRRAQRPAHSNRMPWLRRTYRRRAARPTRVGPDARAV
jgi:hypothetical protein